ncbi:MAG TPA: B-box zinc finger protein [Thermoanaerobaculia bacterium]|nr:B-box zinc finger protein [Thermoanaerobaculia bacterium]
MPPTESTCARHPEVAAAFRCDGCASALCADCVDRSHALFLCKLCGERALPLDAARAADVREHRREEAIAKPYPISAAFGYAFRGMGKYLYAATLAAMAFVTFIVDYGFGCLPIVIGLAFWSLMIGLQFKIVRSTAEGDDQLPDWPEYADWGERFRDIAVYLWVGILQFAPLGAYLALFGGERIFTREPSFVFWLGFAAIAWFGAGVATFGFAAAALEGGGAAMRIDRHVTGFFAARGDALTVTNLAFGLGAAAFLARFALRQVAFFGPAVAGALGAYWVFTSAHLIGVLVRRRRALFREVYA